VHQDNFQKQQSTGDFSGRNEFSQLFSRLPQREAGRNGRKSREKDKNTFSSPQLCKDFS
jgi:hypothetical protein